MSTNFKTKKKIPFIDSVKLKKIENNYLVEKYKSMDEYHTAKEIKHCFDSFISELWERQSDKDQRTKARPFNTCKNKFCHLCAMLRAKKIFTQSYHALEKMKSDGHEFISFHMVLTFTNPQVEEFGDYWEKMNKAFHLFTKKTPELFDYCVGWLAGREVSQGDDARGRNELHPHIHTVMLMKKSWDKGKGNGHYKLNHKQINAFWKKCCQAYGLKSEIFHMLKTHVKSGSALDPVLAGICEVIKYTCEPQHLTNMPDEHFAIMARVLKGKRLMTSGGLLKKYLAMEDPEAQIIHLTDYELIEVIRCCFEYDNSTKPQLIQKKLSKKEIEIYKEDEKNMSESYFKHKKAKELQQIANKSIKLHNKKIHNESVIKEFYLKSNIEDIRLEFNQLNKNKDWLSDTEKILLQELQNTLLELENEELAILESIQERLLPLRDLSEFY